MPWGLCVLPGSAVYVVVGVSNELVSDAKLSDALEYLAKSAGAYAAAQAKARTGERRAKAVRARVEAHSKAKTAAERSAIAECSEPYMNALDDWEAAVHEATEIGAHRERARYLVEVWRSTQANARQGKL